ncbi:uncharacterized protein LOC144043998 [Vanacampus margaritifer]
MLKDLVRERLIAAADEIFGLFETAIASYEEQLRRAREETERHRQVEAVCKTQVVIRMDVQRLIAHQAYHPQLQEHPLHTQKEEEEDSAIMMPLAGKSVQEYKEEPAKLPHHSLSGDQRGEPVPEDPGAPLSQSDDIEKNESLRSNADRQSDVRPSKCSKKKTTPGKKKTTQKGIQQLFGRQELPPEPQGESSILGQMDPQPIHAKEEKKNPQPIHVKVEATDLQFPHVEEKEAEVGTFVLTGVSVESEDDQDKPLECSQLHHDSPSGDHCGGPPPDGLLAPLSDSDDMEEHLRSDTDCEGDKKQLECSEKEKICNKNMTQMWKKGFPCSVCDKSWTNKSKLYEHMRTHTGGQKPFRCSVCGNTFSVKQDMVRHMRTHAEEKPFSCSVCGKKLSTKSTLATHMKIHTGEKPFSCLFCGKNFSLKQVMVRHMSTHTGEKPFSCSACGKKCSRKSTLDIHMRTHTGEKPFSCSFCGKKFSLKNDMLRHMLTHTGDKPFSCSACGKKCSRKSSLDIHMRRHTGEKPFSCLFCGKKFSLKQVMVRHMLTHTGEKPFSCSACGKKFNRKHVMISHMRTHTGERLLFAQPMVRNSLRNIV